MKNTEAKIKFLGKNKKAYFEYFIDQKYEAGVELVGTEVKSIRLGHFNINDAYAIISETHEVFLQNFHISEYKNAGYARHNPTRPKRLLLHKEEIRKLWKKVAVSGFTLIPLSIYLKNSIVKVELGLARGKKQYDKRESIKNKDLEREMQRKMK